MRKKPLKKSTHKFLAVSIGAVVIALFLGIFIHQRSSKKPNIIILLTDTLRRDHLGIYGFDGNISPHINSFARDSVIYTNAVAPASWTKPSVASLFTSLDPLSHKLNDGGLMLSEKNQKRKVPGYDRPLGEIWAQFSTMVLESEHETLAEILSKAGFLTGLFAANPWISEEFGFAQGFDLKIKKRWNAKKLFKAGWEKVKSSEKANSPKFLYYHFIDTHGPYNCSEKDKETLRNSKSIVPSRQLNNAEIEAMPKSVKKWMNWPENKKFSDIREWNLCYAAGVRNFDREFARVIQNIKEEGLYDNSLIIFTSDHGEQFLENGHWDHGKDLHKTLLEIPLLVKFPNGKFAGERRHFPVSLIDLAPSVLSYVGLKKKALDMEGINIFQEKWPKRKVVASGGLEVYVFRRSLENNRYKLIYDLPYKYPDTLEFWPKAWEWDLPEAKNGVLYDLKKDPEEKNPITNHEEIKKMRTLLEKQAKKIFKKQNLNLRKDFRPSEKTLESLKSLGYLQ